MTKRRREVFCNAESFKEKKEKIKNARLVLHGSTKGTENQDTDILEISPSLLEGIVE